MRTLVLVGLALAGLVVLGQAAAAQGFHPRWEIPGLDISRDGGWRGKARRVAAERARLLAQGDFRALNAPLAARAALATTAVGDTFFVPMVLFYYQDTPPSAVRDTSEYSALLFSTSPPFGRPYTLRTYYNELSNGLFTMLGQAIGWARLDSTEVKYTGQPPCPQNPFPNTDNCNGLFSDDAVRRMQAGLREALSKVDGSVDFGLFDNDGPDGTPNSGDDDGSVDMMGFAHAHLDGACASSTNNHIWAHRWVIGRGNSDSVFVTNDPRQGGAGNIRIRDYFIQSGLGGAGSCDSTRIMPIGTAAHEFGHALALPDLYDTDPNASTEGIGRWGLMGSGNYTSPDSPARMEAWSLNELGWVTIVPLTTGGTYAFGPATTGDTAFLVRPTGNNPRGEYFLFENRQALSADTALFRQACVVWHQSQDPLPCVRGGLLIWHIDSAKVVGGAPVNQVNVGSIHGVKLEEADGARDLWCPGAVGPGCNRGDTGDPYPGETANTAFRFTTSPAAIKNSDSNYVGFDIDSIKQVVPGGEMSFRLTFDNTPPPVIVTTDPRPAGVVGASYADTLRASGGNETYTWSFVSGTLPPGVTLAPSGVISGVPSRSGTFAYTARVESGGYFQSRTYSIVVTAPTLTLASVLARLFDPTATTLTPDELRYLDLQGNNNGQFDVGDFKAWLDGGGGA